MPTSVEELRQLHGPRATWWGDLNAHEARRLYHELIPTQLLDENEALPYSVSERAKMAVAARRAARLYVRERSILPVTIGCELLDGVRHLLKGDGFRPDGYSEEMLWAKYAAQYGVPPEELQKGFEGGVYDDVCWTVLQKACTTNKAVDELCEWTLAHAAESLTLPTLGV